MIHLYLSLPEGDAMEHRLVSAILDLNTDVGLVQAASGATRSPGVSGCSYVCVRWPGRSHLR